MRKLIAMLLCLCMLTSLCVVAASADDAEELTVWCWDENFNIAAMNTAAEYYKAAGHDNFKLNVVNVSEEDTQTRMITAFSAGVTEDLPDIVLMSDSAANQFITNFEGCYADLTDYFDWSEFAPYKVSCFTVDDRVYGVPFDSGSAGLFYRNDILEAAGYTAADLENITWWDLIEIAKDIQAKTGKYGFQFDPSSGCAFTWIDSMLQASGTWFYDVNDENEDADFVNNAVVREMSEILKEMWNSGLVYGTDSRDSDGIGAIQRGDVAFVLNAIWYAPTLMAAEDASGLWSYANVPTLTTIDTSIYTNIGGSSWMVLSSSDNQELAIDFLKTVWAGNTDFYDEILLNQAAVATWLPATESEAYQTPVAFFNDSAIYADFASWGSEIPSIAYGTNTWVANGAINSHLMEFFDDDYDLDGYLEAVQETYDITKN